MAIYSSAPRVQTRIRHTVASPTNCVANHISKRYETNPKPRYGYMSYNTKQERPRSFGGRGRVPAPTSWQQLYRRGHIFERSFAANELARYRDS
ncbi:hypothetical protein AHAS_Ahas12G0059400 [Arachis hypogaea]